MTPRDFLDKWKLSRSELAMLVSVSQSTINQWLAKNPKQEPHPSVLKYLEVIDQLWDAWLNQRCNFNPVVSELFEIAIGRKEGSGNHETI